jgi:hypothetical protein
MVKLKIEMLELVIVIVKLKIEMLELVVEMIKPNVEMIEPNVEMLEPVIKIVEPVVEIMELNIESKFSLYKPTVILYNSALDAVASVSVALEPYTPAQQARKETNAGMKKILTRIAKALKSSHGVSPAQMEKCASLIRIVRSVRVVAIDSTIEDPNYISVSQQSFDNLYGHFQDLVSFIAGTSIYDTNISDVKLTALQTLLAVMLEQNQTVITLQPAVTAARIARNHILYDATTGVVDTALAAKTVIGSAYGPKTAEYKGVSGIAFTRPKKGTI